MESITGVIDIYLFYSENNGYSVFKLEDGTSVVGNLPKLNEGDRVELTGEWVKHPRYGKQFKIETANIAHPTTESGIIKYLGSGMIHGIGPVTAKRIVNHFGESTMDVFDNNISRLLEVEGIGAKKLEVIKEGWETQKGVKNVMLFLQSHGISSTYSMKIYKTYGDAAPDLIEKNPYRLISDIWGIGFKTADEIGKNFGFTGDDPFRIKAGIIHMLQQANRDGHVFLPKEELIKEASYMLQTDVGYSDIVFEELEENGEIYIHNGNVYISEYYQAEREIENSINRLLQTKAEKSPKLDKVISSFKEKYSSEQINAIRSSFSEKMMIITGGPGTGKTTTLKGIIQLFQTFDKKIMLAAPTGRAAKRMAEVIGIEAKTIHRLLEFNPQDGSFNYNEDNPLETDLLIIDEVSMIDTLLMYSLIVAISSNTTIIFVGDVDQLPSVGAGNVLKDLIASEKIPLAELNTIFRQAKDSDIITNAHRINKGEMPALNFLQDTDFVFLDESVNGNIPKKILNLCVNELPQKYNFNPVEDIQILSPIYKGEVGVTALNKLFQNELNKSAKVFAQGEKIFKANDKVMQLRNNYDKNVFNGDIGFVVGTNNEDKVLFVSFEGKMVEYKFEDLDEITLAYAVTVHKSQGSEFPCIILPLTTSHYMMLQRNLLYTAITRATKLLILIGTKRALAMGVNNNKVRNRFTSLFKI
ncbi:MAG: ATP-dependent RecD-like DNA helicase [Bacteroidetes bacterium]|nr:ATP-dependent RecD-like DNA helicase [Bacteroidota bacterium]MBU1116464.1 ATP-dependent RecD-like DNA helicase [Bacteroidota bacterium]MBU1797301.1 ATP-dependent RecD-like DNA helicase [Bacteroidota bacterium]